MYINASGVDWNEEEENRFGTELFVWTGCFKDGLCQSLGVKPHCLM